MSLPPLTTARREGPPSLAGRASPLPELPLQYAAFAIWQQALLEWNDTAARYPTDACLHTRIAARAALAPDSAAATFAGETLSYGELDAQASRLARRLCRLGVGPEVAVGVCVERSLDLVVGLLGVLKAGGAYLPLDPSYPRQRLAAMLADAGPRVVLVQSRTVSALPDHPGRRVFLDTPAPRAESGLAPSALTAGPENLAYVIFTSGSTGRPKGVMNTHRAIVNRLLWMQSRYGLSPADRVLQKTPVSFDVSVWELFWPLLSGACLVVALPGGHQDPAYLVRTMAEEEITTVHFVPAMLQAFLAEPGVERVTSLARVFASGEALPARLAERFFGRFPGVELHNLYGPTEAAVDVTSWACAAGAPQVPIGRPVANTQIRLLDAGLRPLPIGACGELYIGGVQLARGYCGRAELTAERFVPDPEGEPGARLYRTGDLARHRPGGEIEYLGRIDHQVKLRGFRIELGEIESTLAAHPAVRAAAVLLAESTESAESAESAGEEPRNRRLVAYVVAAPATLNPSAWADDPESGRSVRSLVPRLRDHLQARLPEHMVPSAFVLLDALPLTPNGKVDRRALALLAPAVGPAQGERGGAARTELEALVAGIWATSLGRGPVGVEENFFDYGGDSIVATRIAIRLREAGFAVELRDLFRHPTIEGLAKLLGERGAPISGLPEEASAAPAAGRFATVELDDEELAAIFGEAAA